MLCPGDARMVEGDAALPGLRVLLDPEAFGAALARLCGTAITSATPTYARYKPGTSCLVAYDVRTEERGASVPVYARTHAGPDALSKTRKAAERPAVAGPLGAGTFVSDDPPLAVFVFPNDHVLRALARLAEPGERTRLLGKALNDHGRPAITSLERLRYKPERRFVGRASVHGGASMFVKLYTEEDAPACIANARAFYSEGPLRVACLLGSHERRGLAVWEWVEGKPLLDSHDGPLGLRAPSILAGAALACLHHQNANLPFTYDPSRCADMLAESRDAIGAISPTHAKRAQQLAERLVNCFAAHKPVPIHGDFSASQVLLTGNSATFLDFDRAGQGPAVLDLGNFLANLESLAITGEIRQADMSACAGGVLDGYARSRLGEGCDELRARTLAPTAFSLFRIAVEPFRSRRVDWPELLDAYLTRAEVLLGNA